MAGLIGAGNGTRPDVVRAEPGRGSGRGRAWPDRSGRGSWPPWAGTGSHPSGPYTDLSQLPARVLGDASTASSSSSARTSSTRASRRARARDRLRGDAPGRGDPGGLGPCLGPGAVLPARELIVPVFAVAIVANLGAFLISTPRRTCSARARWRRCCRSARCWPAGSSGPRLAAWTRAARGGCRGSCGRLAVGGAPGPVERAWGGEGQGAREQQRGGGGGRGGVGVVLGERPREL